MRSSLERLGCALVLALLGAIPAHAQSGAIQGTLVDAQGGVLAGAAVSAVDEAKAVTAREARTAADGSFKLQPLLPGKYTLKAELTGFRPLERRGLVLDANQVMDLGRLALGIGAVVDVVTVEATPPLVETATAQKSYVISGEQILELQTNGRGFDSLMKTLPGVATSDRSDFALGFSGTNNFSVNGGRTSMNNVFLDGTPNTDQGDNGSQYTQLSLDAVGEFKVQTSVFNAEYGRQTGVLISAVTRSGGQDFHGSLWEFNRDGSRDASNPFNGLKPNTKSNVYGGNLGGWIPLPGVSSADSKKLFFFVNYERTIGQRPNGNPYFDVYSPAVLAGDLSSFLRPGNIAGTNFQNGTVFKPGTIVRNAAGNIIGGVPYPGNIIPRSDWSRNTGAFLAFLGSFDRSPGTPVPGNPQLLRVPGQDIYHLRKHQESVRIDYHVSPQTNLFLRFVNDFQHEEQGLGIFSGANQFPAYPMLREKPGQSWSLNLFNVLSPHMTNEVILAYNRQSQVVDVVPDVDSGTYDRAALGFTFGQLFPPANTRNRFPNICNTSTGDCIFSYFNSNWENVGKDYAVTDNLSYVHGSHTWKTGVYLNMDDKQQQPSWNDAGSFVFGPNAENPNDTGLFLGNLLTGNYTSFTQSNAKLLGNFRFKGFEYYLQDTWKLGSRLTLEYGARYAFLGPTYTRGDVLASYFDPARYDPSQAVQIQTANGLFKGSIIPGSGNPLNGMVREGDGIPEGFVKHRHQVAPRVGFACDVSGDGKMAIRGGAGVFFERIRQNVNNFDGLANPPVLQTPLLGPGRVDNLSSALLAGGALFPTDVKAMDQNGFIPTIYAWSLDVQRQLPGQVLLDVAYVGNTARHLQYVKNINTLPAGVTTSTPVLVNANNTSAAIRPFKGYAAINMTDYGANSNYHSLQVRLSRRFAKGFTGNVNYTLSRALTQQTADDNSIQYAFDRARDWGPTNQDRKHVLTIDYVYKLPNIGGSHGLGQHILNGWELSGITRFWSGLPLNITSNGNTGTLGAGPRADYIGGDLYPAQQTTQQWFNPLAFARPADGQLGNVSRNSLRGPGVNNWDMSLFKNTQFGRVRTQLRVEAFNVFNHPQFFGVNTGLSVPNPGQAVTPATVGTFGSITSFRDARAVQLAVKLYF